MWLLARRCQDDTIMLRCWWCHEQHIILSAHRNLLLRNLKALVLGTDGAVLKCVQIATHGEPGNPPFYGLAFPNNDDGIGGTSWALQRRVVPDPLDLLLPVVVVLSTAWV